MYFCLGAMFATIDLSTVDFAQEHGHKPLAGFILGAYALGSAVGGLWYGSRTWRAPVHRRFAITLCAGRRRDRDVLGHAGPGRARRWSSSSPAWPSRRRFIAGFSLIEQQAPAGRRTEALAWLTSAISVGVAAGSAVAGQVIDAGGARWGYALAACCGAAAVAVCLPGLRRLRLPGAGRTGADARRMTAGRDRGEGPAQAGTPATLAELGGQRVGAAAPGRHAALGARRWPTRSAGRPRTG